MRAIVDRLRDWLDDWRESHRAHEPPPSGEETIPWQVNVGRQTFSFASVGTPLEPLLTSRQIKRLADMLGFFRTDLAGRRLDVPATVRTAVRAGDPGRMCFQPLAATRHVLVLEDALALREFRTSLVDELCNGFQATGVTVERGRFRHAVDRWTNRRGRRSIWAIRKRNAKATWCWCSPTAAASGGGVPAGRWNGSPNGRGSLGSTGGSRGAT